MPANAGIKVTQASVIPLKNGIQVTRMGMDPGFHRRDDNAGVTENKSQLQVDKDPLGLEPTVVPY
jgi:hypothetical protein